MGARDNSMLNLLPVHKYAILLLLRSLWCMHLTEIYIIPHKRTCTCECKRLNQSFVIACYKFLMYILPTFSNNINPIESNSGGVNVLHCNIRWVRPPLMWYLSVESGEWKKGMTWDKDVMVTELPGHFNHILYTPDKLGIMRSYIWWNYHWS